MQRPRKSRGQALVEFALAATLIFFLLAAAVDLGFMFFAVQGLHNAAQEGGTYGSRWLTNNASGTRVLDANAIRDHVRHESGARGGIGFVNLLDLNNDGTPDINPDGPISACTAAKCQINPATGNYVVYDYIQVYMLNDTNLNGDPLDDGTAPNYPACSNPSSISCFINVVVSFDYRTVFPLSPTFARQRTLRSSFTMRVRDDMARIGANTTPATFATITPTPQSLALTIVNFHYDRSSVNPRQYDLKAFVTLNGNAFTGALVTATIHRSGAPDVQVTLGSIGNGYYTACNAGTVYNGSSGPTVDMTATNGTGGSATAFSSNATSTYFPDCPSP